MRARFERSHWAQPVARYRRPPISVWALLGKGAQVVVVVWFLGSLLWNIVQ